MKRTIFYSWQSDLPNSSNRGLIKEALENAIKSLKREDSYTINPRIDQDTKNTAGSPDIAETIFGKIALADIFIADVSIINKDSADKKTPNPNILIELGYAVSNLGWDKIILVQNSAYGGPESLPFDLRGRRTVQYDAPPGFEKAKVRALLQGRLEGSLRSAFDLESSLFLPTGRDSNLWWGQWRQGNKEVYGGELFIRETSSDGFLFDLGTWNGAHTGSLTAYAKLVCKDLAYARIPNGNLKETGEIMLRRLKGNGRRTIEITETASCSNYRGMRGCFSGLFDRVRDPWFDLGLINELELNRLYSITGEHFKGIIDCTGDVGLDDCIDDFDAKVITGGVAGLYTEMESIIMLDERGNIWAAYIKNKNVYYFTNSKEWKRKLPKTIDAWRDRFKQKKVLFSRSVNLIPYPMS